MSDSKHPPSTRLELYTVLGRLGAMHDIYVFLDSKTKSSNEVQSLSP